MKININPIDDNGVLVPSKDLTSLIAGVRDGIQSLGPLSEAIKKIEASFTHNNGLKITIHFADPLGNESYFGTDYRFIGKKSPRPSFEEICEIFKDKNGFIYYMRKFLAGAQQKLADAQKNLERQIAV
jgi:hypothetical protein